MGRDDHGVLLDSKNQWWVHCPNSTTRIAEESEPIVCPHCGDDVSLKTEMEKEAKKHVELKIKIEVHLIVEEEVYCAVVKWKRLGPWSDADIVIRDLSPTLVFNRALARVAENGWWK